MMSSTELAVGVLVFFLLLMALGAILQPVMKSSRRSDRLDRRSTVR